MAGRASSAGRKRRGRGERRLEDALDALGHALSSQGLPWMLIGGLAVIARGVRRFTTDIDAVVQGDAVDVDVLLAALAQHGIVPRIPDARAFATSNLILLVTHEPSGVDLDISMGWTGFEREALGLCSNVAFGPLRVPIASAEDLVIFKVVAARPVDIEDARTLLALYPKIDLARVRMRVRELANLLDEPGRVTVLEQLVCERNSTPDRRRSRAATRTPRGKAKRAKTRPAKRKRS